MSAQTPSETAIAPVAWRREWNGDDSDLGEWIYEEDEVDLDHDGYWERLYAETDVSALESELAAAKAEFKNFHRLLCERFGYHHDDVDWKRDQLSLIEHMATDRDQLRATVARQAEEIERVRKDAGRYQWLRSGDNDERVLCWDPTVDDDDEDAARCWLPRQQELDNAIDEAIREDSEATHRPATAEETAAIDTALAKEPTDAR